MDQIYKATIPTPLGDMVAFACDRFLHALLFKDMADFDRLAPPMAVPEMSVDQNSIMSSLSLQLDAYFSGGDVNFDRPLAFVGTDFQVKTWQSLSCVPVGATVTYKSMAHEIGNPKSVRAVANAIGANRHLVVVPCHRVIRSDGFIGGYSGGVDRKNKLLSIDGAIKQLKV